MVHFGTGGFRGVIGDDFTKENVKLIAQALADLIHEEKSKTPVYVGYDFRFESDMTASWIADTLAANGIQVLLSDSPSPTPTVMQACQAKDTDYGIMITASHNPYYYNGVKLFQKGGMDAEKTMTDKVEKKLSGLKEYQDMDHEEALKQGLIQVVDILHPFLDHIQEFVVSKENKDLKILLDPIYGTGALTLKPTLERMGMKNIHMVHGHQDALFGHRLPNPLESNMKDDREMLLKEHYDLAIGTDSDCDRIAILDEKGTYVDANEILGSIYYYLVKYKGMKGDIVKNVATSDLLDCLAEKLGFHCREVDVGFKNISAGIKKYDALVGGESSGGFTMRGYIFGKDSTFASALFVEMVSEMKKPVSKLIEEVNDFADFHKKSYEGVARFKDRASIDKACHEKKPILHDRITNTTFLGANVKYRFANGDWALLRFSGTEPLMRVYVETSDPEIAKQDMKALDAFIAENDR